ncbi:unnamed protein product [Schistosoma mattheei]|uniref:Uncharacterized protein n=1 Tax=Schistosoma mattheei TaxID=31246 RepID=A0A3P8J952_9TREM|nr:unnamed protein product [Schistosoma mattheei]
MDDDDALDAGAAAADNDVDAFDDDLDDDDDLRFPHYFQFIYHFT